MSFAKSWFFKINVSGEETLCVLILTNVWDIYMTVFQSMQPLEQATIFLLKMPDLKAN